MTSPTADTALDGEVPVLFRASKRRKGYRQRTDDIDTPSPMQVDATPLPPPSNTLDTEDTAAETTPSVSEILRLRRKNRQQGVEFRPEQAASSSVSRTTLRHGHEDENTEQSLVQHVDPETGLLLPAEPEHEIGGISRRFAPQTGLTGELVNKHMVEYVESKLAQRRAAETRTTYPNKPGTNQNTSDGPHASTAMSLNEPSKPTMRGKLMEIDLGEEERQRNVALTERAQRRLAGEAIDDDVLDEDTTDSGQRSGNRKSARDKQPARRDRRPSDAVKRDRLVEEFLSENKLDVNHLPQLEDPSTSTSAPQDTTEGRSLDDRVAEQFRREFLDALNERRQRRRRPATNAPPRPSRAGPKRDLTGEVLRGPKLGGSRNARSAVRDALLQKEKEQKAAAQTKRRW